MFRSIPVGLAVIVLLGASLAPDDAYARHRAGHRVAASHPIIERSSSPGYPVAYQQQSRYQQPPYQSEYRGRGECGN
jgi:hypothetical protein